MVQCNRNPDGLRVRWAPLFEPRRLPYGLTVLSLDTAEELTLEGNLLQHCVGSGDEPGAASSILPEGRRFCRWSAGARCLRTEPTIHHG